MNAHAVILVFGSSLLFQNSSEDFKYDGRRRAKFAIFDC